MYLLVSMKDLLYELIANYASSIKEPLKILPLLPSSWLVATIKFSSTIIIEVTI